MEVSHQKKSTWQTGWELLLDVLGLCSAQDGTCSHHGDSVMAAAQTGRKSLGSSNREMGILVLRPRTNCLPAI